MSAPRPGVFALALLLTGCSVVNHNISQLEQMKRHRAGGDLRANSNESITCADADAECYQLHLIKGDACYALSQQAQGPARRPLDSCAADELSKGLTLAPGPQTPLGETRLYARKRLEVLHDLIDTRTSNEESGVETLAKAASDFRQQYQTDPAGPYYLASARLTSVEDHFLVNSDTTALCSALPAIERLIGAGSSAPGDLESQYTNLRKTLDALRRTGNCT